MSQREAQFATVTATARVFTEKYKTGRSRLQDTLYLLPGPPKTVGLCIIKTKLAKQEVSKNKHGQGLIAPPFGGI